MSDILNKINQICRVCLGEQSLMFSLSETRIDFNRNISEMLMSCTGIKVDMNDNLPQLLCNSCSERLENAYLFKQDCERSDQTLRKLISENIDVKTEDFDSLDAIEFVKTEIKEEIFANNEKNETQKPNVESDTDSNDDLNLLERRNKITESAIKSQTKKSKYLKSRIYKCFCGKNYIHHSNLWRHRESDKHFYFHCYICWERFYELDTLKNHEENYHRDKTYSCNNDDCKLEFNDFRLLTFHRKNDHEIEKYLQCLKCNTEYSSHEKWDIHVQRHLRNPYKCELCGENFTTNKDLQEHIIIHPDYFKCTICSKVCNSKKSLHQHKKTHENPVICEECGKLYNTKAHLQAHIRVIHQGQRRPKQDRTKKNCLCTDCGKTLIFPSVLKSHIQAVHEKIKPFSCDQCEYSCSNNVKLRNHKRIHTGEKPYSCEFCGKSFARCSYLHIHKRFHTGERPYKCSYCEKGFTTKKDMNVHERTHTGIKLYECQICNNSFSTLHYLKIHIRKHDSVPQ